MSRPIKARKSYTCAMCNAKIRKGDVYYRKSRTVGEVGGPREVAGTDPDGMFYVLVRRWTVTDTLCARCT